MAIENEVIVSEVTNYAPAAYLKKSMLGLEFDDTTEQDENLDMLGETASRMIDDYTKQIFYKTIVQDEKKKAQTDFTSNIVLRTEYKPIVKVLNLRVESIPSEYVNIPLNLLDIHYKQGTITLYPLGYASVSVALRKNSFISEYFNTVITYEAGYEIVPAPVKRAAALLVRNMLIPGSLAVGIKTTAINRGPLKKVQSKSYTEEYDTTGITSSGFTGSVATQPDFLFTSDIRILLQPYLKRGVL